jgi:hypothetical protein
MRDKSLPVSGTKVELVAKVKEIIETEALEEELEAGVFADYIVPPGVNFKDLPENNWSAERIPKVKESDVCNYLKKHRGYTKNYRAGVRLVQCRHAYSIEATVSNHCFVRAKCRQTMRKNPPFYTVFATFTTVNNAADTLSIEGGNCMCLAGESQSCVHMAALLLTLAEVTLTAYTSLPCARSRPSGYGLAMLSQELDFGRASVDGYFKYTGPNFRYS